MTDQPAAMAGVYVDMKFMPGLKMARISIEIPIEHSNEFIRMFGTPDRTDPVHVGIARLNAAAVPERAEPAAPVVKAETVTVVRVRKPSEIAALKCQNEDFQVWLGTKYPKIWDKHYIDGGYLSASAADLTLKEVLGIASKRDLDEPDGPKFHAFDRLLTDFEVREFAR